MTVNNSGKGPVNSLASDDHFDLGELGRIRDQFHTEPAAVKAMRMRGNRAQSQMNTIDEAEAAVPGVKSLPEFGKLYLRNERLRDSINSRLSIYEETKQDRLNDQAVNLIGRQFSPSAINSYVQRNANSLEAQVSGTALQGQGYISLDAQRKQIMGQMNELRHQSMSVASTYIDQNQINPAAQSVLSSGSEQMKELAKQLVPITVAMQQLKQQGLDPKGRQEELARIGNKAAGLLHSNELVEQMKSGQGLGQFSMAELKKKETEAAEKLIKALTALNSAAGKSADELNALNKDAEEAAKNFKEIGEAKDLAGRNNSNKFDTIKMIAGTIMEVLDIGTNAYQNVAINQPMQMVANTAAAADLENQKYNSWHAALSGNMHERMNLNWEAARGFGNTMASNQNTVHNLREANYLIGTAMGAAQVGVSIYNGTTSAGGAISGVNPIEQGAQGAKTLVSGLAGGTVELAAQQRQTDMASLRIAGQHAYMAAQKALTRISGQQMQGYRNYAMGINETAGAMGGEVGEAFLNATGGADFLQQLSNAGIGTKEFGSLSLRGAQQAGSRFDQNQVFSAVNYERLGFGSADDNMRRMGMLAGAGQGNAANDLGRIIEEAMQRGLNSSKALEMIVENTAKISQDALMAGAAGDPTVGVSQAILRAVDQSNPNKEQALMGAQRGFERGEAARTNISTSFPGILNVDRNMKTFGVDRLSATLLTKLSSAQIEGLRGISGDGAEKNRREYLERMGISTTNMDPSMFSGDNLVRALDDNAAVSVLAQQSGVGYAISNPGAYAAELRNNKGNKAVLEALVYGKNLDVLSPEQRSLRERQAAVSTLNGNNPIEDMARAGVLTGVLDQKVTEKSLNELGLDSRMNLTDEKRLGGKADSAQAREGAAAFGASAKVAMSALAESGRQAFETMGKNAERVWKDAAHETAKNFGDSASLMGNAASALESAAVKMTENTQLMAASGASFASAVSDAIAKIKDKVASLDGRSHGPQTGPKTAYERREEEKNFRGAPRGGGLD